MNTNAKNAYEFIMSKLDAGFTIYIGNSRKSTKITPSNFAKWVSKGHTMFKLSNNNNDLLIARGSKFDCIIANNLPLSRILATKD